MNRKIIYILLSFFISAALNSFSVKANDEVDGKSLPKNPSPYLCKNYHALVVGVSNYKHWPVLPNAVNDAKEVAGVLKRAGFSVDLALDPTAQQLNAALEALVKNGQNQDQGILLYYTGLGETRILADGTQLGYIIPKDCPSLQHDPTWFEDHAVNMKDIETLSIKIKSKHQLFLFDTTFSDDSLLVKNPSLKILGPKSMLPMRQFLIAGKANEPIPDKSMFKTYFLKGIKGEADLIRDGYITGSELAVYLTNGVLKATTGQQHPQYGMIKDIVSQGDFIFQPVQAGMEKGKIFVTTTPRNATIKILNIIPRFQNGMELDPGKYHLEVSAKDYETLKKWVELAEGEVKNLEFNLIKIKVEPVYINTLGMKFIYIKPGTFIMGSSTGLYQNSDNEKAHKVTLTKGFYAQATEVTVGQFRQFLQATGYITDSEKKGACWTRISDGRWKKNKNSKWDKPGSWETRDLQVTGIHPVTCVSWNDAQAFISWLSAKDGRKYALPTEAQWEYACRAGTSTPFSFGNCLNSKQANFGNMGPEFSKCPDIDPKSHLGPAPVGSLADNAWGLYDMHGNVAEWCKDLYGSYPKDPVENPQGPSTGTERVIRGGHWSASAVGCRSAKRGGFIQNSASDVIGFRLVILFN